MGTSESNSRGRIIVAHDNAMFAVTLREFLTPTYEVVAVVGDGVALLRAADELKPDVAVVDTGLTLPNGKNASCQVKERYPAVKLVCVSQQGEPTLAVDAFRRGASALLVKSSSAAELLTAIQEALLDRVYISPLIARKVVTELLDGQKQNNAEPRLTSRQREVLQLLAEGKSMKAIAETLGISARTVQFHKYEMMKNLKVRTNAGIVHYAIHHGIVRT